MATDNDLLTYVESVLLSNSAITDLGISPNRMSRRLNRLLKNFDPNNSPTIVFAIDEDRRERWAPIQTGRLYVVIYDKDDARASSLSGYIQGSLDKLTTKSETLSLYRLWDSGGPANPMFDPNLNAWYITNVFDYSFM
jgi:hypothetical protein